MAKPRVGRRTSLPSRLSTARSALLAIAMGGGGDDLDQGFGCIFPEIDLATGTRKESTMSDDVDRSELPIPDPTFTGTIHRTLDGSVPDWNIATSVEPPRGAPNVLLVLIDDAGFGNPSTFGGPIHTPNYTRMAE